MRSHIAFFGIFACLSALPACQKLEDRAEASVESKVEKKVGMSGLGGTFTTGACPDLPKQVPLYPGAAKTRCLSFDPATADKSPLLQALGVADGTLAPSDSHEMFMLTFAANETPAQVRAFYEQHLRDFQKSSDLPPSYSFAPPNDFETFANADEKYPVAYVVVGFSPNKEAAPGKTPVVISVLMKAPSK